MIHDSHRSRGSDAGEPIRAPTACPVCRSSDLTTTSKVVTAGTYWRCVSCGEVWNVERREVSRNTSFGSFRGQRP